jgi:ATP-dependent DNA helicase RecQ
MVDTNIDQLYQEYFPNMAEQFSLKDFQKQVVKNVLSGNNTLCIMPTGGGKSLIYWLSGLAKKGITIVISPLIALIDEQAEKIEEQGYEVLKIHGGMPANKQIEILKKFYKKEHNPDFIFVSPERISTDGFFEYCVKSRKEDIKLVAIDEVHCVSQWGFNFRPFYKRIPDFLEKVYGVNQYPTILGLTATLNGKEIIDICTEFNITKKNVIKNDMLVRSEIDLKVLKFTNEDEKEVKLWQLLNIHQGEKILVYLYRKYKKRGTEELAREAQEKGYKAASFHGDMSAKERQSIIHFYKNGEIDVIFATNAFGMGIDIPDIRVVIHFMIPESVEQYYQEVGRAARDGNASQAYVLYTNKNIQVKKTHFIDRSLPTIEQLEKVYKKITQNKIALKTLQYFEDEEVQQCLPYFLEQGILQIEAKGFTNVKMLSKIKSDKLQEFYDSTTTKGTISIIKKQNCSPSYIGQLVYESIANDNVKLSKNLDKCLIVKSFVKVISEDDIQALAASIEEKKRYKHNLLDYFVRLLDTYESSKELHQEIGMYLGVPKFKLGKIYKTLKGDYVRSKSEVIIANILFNEDIEYKYEEELYYSGSKKVSPDFTISLGNQHVYWEHLGMIGIESYDERWLAKLEIYNAYFPNRLITTYEGATLSDTVKLKIKALKHGIV